MSDVWPALSISLRVSLLATMLAMLVALPLAAITSRQRFVGKSVFDALLLLPLVLPPTVVGYLLLWVLGREGLVGRLTGESLIFTITGAVLAAAIVAFPLLYLPTKSGMSAISQSMLDTGRIYGASRLQLFWHVLLPLSRRHIAAGAVLAFARAMGEFGATMMVLGWRPGKTTLPILVYGAYADGRLEDAWLPVLMLVGASVVIVAVYHRLLRET